MKNKILMSLAILVTCFACEDNLEFDDPQTLPPEETVTLAQLPVLLNGAYSEAGDNNSLGGYFQLASDLLGNTDQVNWGGTFSQPREFFTKRMTVGNTFVRDMWLNSYEVIFAVNLIIEEAENVEDEAQRNLLIGNAQFLRGLLYFELVRAFGVPYEIGGVNSGLGVPIVLEANFDFSSVEREVPRNTVAEGYTQILSDLNSAQSLLATSVENGYADRFSAQAILARIYLQMGNYSRALSNANNVIESSGHSLSSDYASAFNHTGISGPSSETVFEFLVTTQDGENDLHTFYASSTNQGRQDVSIQPAYTALFDNPTLDSRATFRNPEINDVTGKYDRANRNVGIVRLAEMYLIRAECNQRLSSAVGNTPLDDINTLRERANSSEDPLQAQALNLTSVNLDAILLERQLELAFEGFLLHDIKRVQSTAGGLNYNDSRLVMPIPQREIDANPNLVQNEGY